VEFIDDTYFHVNNPGSIFTMEAVVDRRAHASLEAGVGHTSNTRSTS
jgi:hypothetical protein